MEQSIPVVRHKAVGITNNKDNASRDSTPNITEAEKIYEEVNEAASQFEKMERRKVVFLSFAGPAFALLLCCELLFVIYDIPDEFGALRTYLPTLRLSEDTQPQLLLILINVLIFWVSTLTLAVALSYFVVKLPTEYAALKLERIRKRHRSVGNTGRKQFLKDELNRLAGEVANAYFYEDDKILYQNAVKWRALASDILEQFEHKPSDGKRTIDLKGKTYDLTCVEDLITSIETSVARQKRSMQHQRIWRDISVAVVLLYAIIFLILLATPGLQDRALATFGVPTSVLVWSAIGSIGCVLYKLYSKSSAVHLQLEIRWLIARPIIGIIMGALSYFAINAGLLILTNDVGGNQQASLTDGPQNVTNTMLVAAFLAGFSDKFYNGVVRLLIGRINPPSTPSLPSDQN